MFKLSDSHYVIGQYKEPPCIFGWLCTSSKPKFYVILCMNGMLRAYAILKTKLTLEQNCKVQFILQVTVRSGINFPTVCNVQALRNQANYEDVAGVGDIVEPLSAMFFICVPQPFLLPSNSLRRGCVKIYQSDWLFSLCK